MNDHPPIGTPLSAFTPEMLDRLPVGSRFGVPPGHPGNVEVEKVAGGWQHVGRDRPPEQGDALLGVRPLIRVGPEQAADPGPLPDPWPGVQVEYVNSAGFIVRAVVSSWWTVAESPGAGCFRIRGEAPETFHPAWDTDTIREVRTATGEVLWRRA